MALLVWLFTMLTALLKTLSEKCCLRYLSEVAFVLSNFVSFLCGSFQDSFPALSCAVCILCSATKFLFVLRTTVFPRLVAMLLVRNSF